MKGLPKMETYLYDKGPYLISGINAHLLNWIQTSPLAQRAFCVTPVHADDHFSGQLYDSVSALVEDLAEMFGASQEWQIVKADMLTQKLWRAHPEFGPYPCKGFLMDLQWDGTFYPGYRDHVLHQVNVMLIGLYLYDRCAPLQKAIRGEIGSETETAKEPLQLDEEFLRRWLAASLIHDVGYILENERVCPVSQSRGERRYQNSVKTLWDEFLELINNYLTYPIAHTLSEQHEIQTASATESTIVKENGLPPGYKLEAINDLLKYEPVNGSRRSRVLADLNVYAKKVGLPINNNADGHILEDYFSATQRDSQVNRGPYRDHGIASALLFVNGWRSFKDRLYEINNNDQARNAFQENKGFGSIDLVSLSERLDWNTIRSAAGAVALHNINAEQRHIPGYTSENLNPFARIEYKGPNSCPLAFLLALSDTLQNWGRPRFSRFRKEGENLQPSDIHLECKNDMIYVSFRKSPEKEFQRLKDGLGAILNKNDYTGLLKLESEFDFTPKYPSSLSAKTTKANGEKHSQKKDRTQQGQTIPKKIKFKIKDLTGVDPVQRNMHLCANPLTPDSKKRRYCAHQWQSLHLTSELRRSIEAIGEIAQLYQKLTKFFKEIEQIVRLLKKPMHSTRTMWDELLDFDWYNLKNIVQDLNAFMDPKCPRSNDVPGPMSGKERLYAVLLTKVWSDEKGSQYQTFVEGYDGIPSVVDFFNSYKLGRKRCTKRAYKEAEKHIATIQLVRRSSSNIQTLLRRRIEQHYLSSKFIKKEFSDICQKDPDEWPQIYEETKITGYLTHLQVKDTRIWRSE